MPRFKTWLLYSLQKVFFKTSQAYTQVIGIVKDTPITIFFFLFIQEISKTKSKSGIISLLKVFFSNTQTTEKWFENSLWKCKEWLRLKRVQFSSTLTNPRNCKDSNLAQASRIKKSSTLVGKFSSKLKKYRLVQQCFLEVMATINKKNNSNYFLPT